MSAVLDRLTIGQKLNGIVIIGLLGLLLSAVLAAWQLHDTKFADRQAMARTAVEAARSITAAYQAREAKGEMPREQAQAAALFALSAIRHNGEEYVWVNDRAQKILMHPVSPALNGQSMAGFKDPTGRLIFNDFTATATASREGGYVTYMWPKPGQKEPVAKVSFVTLEPSWGWIIGSGIYVDEVQADALAATRGLAIGVLLIAVIMLAMAVLFRRSLTAPLAAMTGALRALAVGDYAVALPVAHGRTEMGQMAAALVVLRDAAREREALAAEQTRAQAAEAKRAETVTQLIHLFDGRVGGVLQAVGTASSQLDVAAREMSAVALEADRQAVIAATATEQTSGNVQAVASATEELTASIREIGQQVTESSRITAAAVEEATRTRSVVGGLAEAASRIGSVLDLIRAIAEQTNLLALNATIEAARAGDAGKGFAVVAAEVKSLANQTARATEEISAQIGAIRQASDGAVGAIHGIGQTVSRVNEIAAAVAAAVEEQAAATSEIARNVAQAAAGTGEVTQTVAGVRSAASRAGGASQQVLGAGAGLAAQAGDLRAAVTEFLEDIRAA